MAGIARRRVVITGMGICCPLGINVDTLFNNLLASKTAIRTLTAADYPDIEKLNVRIAAPVDKDFPEQETVREMGPYGSAVYAFSYYSSCKAIEDAGWDPAKEADLSRVATTFGSGVGPIPRINDGYSIAVSQGYDKVDPHLGIAASIGQGANFVAKRYGITGPSYAIGTACTTGQVVVGEGMRMIQRGEADMAICSSTEDGTIPLSVVSFHKIGALSDSQRPPEEVSRPFDEERCGFVAGGGAGAVVVEELEHAKRRGAKIYAEVLGNSLTSDAFHFTRPLEDGTGAKRCLTEAMREAGITPDQVDVYYAHATSTKEGDMVEAMNIYSVFGSPGPNITSMKGNIGHLLSSAGVVQTIAAVMSAKHDIIPPILNTKNPLKVFGKPLNFVLNEPRRTTVNYALCSAFGFGGTNSTLIIGKYRE
jgi:3-oxoacyl-[acyl-carrier-protein] synthase II